MGKRLSDLPAHMRTRAWIEHEIAYEEAGGHGTTVHECKCGKWCRASMCAACWRELLEQCDD